MMYTNSFDDEDRQQCKNIKANMEAQMGSQLQSLMTQMGIMVVTGVATEILSSLLVTNYHKESLTGDKKLSPTEDNTVLESQERSAAHQQSEVAHEEFNGQEGELKGADTEASAATSSTDAAGTNLTAAKAEAGTIDTATTAMQIN